jgi:2-polyprenyl-6-methoxyphenol hydroxylase-like FAD-dependent oxidoreductase
MRMKVIVSGAGIAGLSLAYWLDRLGASTLVVERAPRFQALGHYISLKGNGVEMVRRMGIYEACEARSAPIEETRFYTMQGRLLRSERTAALNKMLGGYILFRRADLQAALYELARGGAEMRFGTQIAEARRTEDGVEVVLSDGSMERGDLLVGADGIHSNVRGLVFGDGFERPLGGFYIAVTQTLRHGLALATHSYVGVGRMVNLFAVTDDSVSTVVYVNEGAGEPPKHDALAMRDYLLEVSAGFPDHVRDIVGRIGAEDFVFADVIAQVEMPRITAGRCVLVGDAAHCPTFLSGMGSSLALQDAHILAGCLARSPSDAEAACRQYEEVMTPIARRYHNGARSMRGIILSQSRVEASLRNLALQVVPERLLERGVRRFYDAERPLADVPAVATAVHNSG